MPPTFTNKRVVEDTGGKRLQHSIVSQRHKAPTIVYLEPKDPSSRPLPDIGPLKPGPTPKSRVCEWRTDSEIPPECGSGGPSDAA
ncbi:hypothetical protein Hypma_007209 [Hypsizygus marmoreus]|uniref:Uncharacterized protein n=1 Tax=Hypsizygus marmoreus TaxID=39966 RepID=A0A369K713_HYPMA|nr:hypothetical protein Hypma_007209 [Hypsizygus marmoreus]